MQPAQTPESQVIERPRCVPTCRVMKSVVENSKWVVCFLAWTMVLQGNAVKCSICIDKYADLEEIILSNSTIINALQETFIPTGEDPSHFVIITYKYSFCEQLDSSGDADYMRNERHSTYIWSDTAFYLLGPEPLYWFTLSAVKIHQKSITIVLPCLCQKEFCSLLSRLTYLVSIYYYSCYVQILMQCMPCGCRELHHVN